MKHTGMPEVAEGKGVQLEQEGILLNKRAPMKMKGRHDPTIRVDLPPCHQFILDRIQLFSNNSSVISPQKFHK
jgi:hypothetical protein